MFFNMKTYILARFWDPAASFLASLAFYAWSLLRQAFTQPGPCPLLSLPSPHFPF